MTRSGLFTVCNEVAKVMFLQVSVCPQGGAWSGGAGGCLLCTPPPGRDGYCCRWYVSYWNAFLLPAATKLGQGNIFTSICLSTGGRRGVCLSACWDIPPPPSRHSLPRSRHPPPGADPPREVDSSIRSTSGLHASYWNAFLFK